MKNIWMCLLLTGLLASCIGDEFNTEKLVSEIELNSGIALPLAKADITMGDILSEETDFVKYYKDADGNERIMLVQDEDSVSHIGLNDMVQLSSQSTDIPVPYAAFLVEPEISSQVNIPLNISNANLSAIDINYTLSMTGHNLIEPITVQITFSNADMLEVILQDNDRFEQNYTMPLSVNNNEIPIDVRIKPTNGTPSTNETGQLSIGMSDIHINYIRGTIGEIPIQIDNGQYNFEFDVFNNFPDGIEFDDPKLKLLINNATPFSGLFNAQITGELGNNGSIDLLTPSLMSFNACPANQDVVSDTITIDKDNSNFKDFLFEVPTSFAYEGHLLLNPGADINSEVELDNMSTIYMGYAVEVPLEVIINSTLTVDTMNISDIDMLDELQKAKLVINSINGFPFEAEAFIDLFDSESNTVTETIEASIIEAAEVDAEGIVSSKTENTEEIELSNDQIEKLKSADQMILRLGLKSSNFEANQPVVILTDNDLSLQLSLKGQLKL